MGNQLLYPLDRIYSLDSTIHLLNNLDQKVMGSTPIESTQISSELTRLAGGIVSASKVFSGFGRGVVKPCGELEGDTLKSRLLEDYVFIIIIIFFERFGKWAVFGARFSRLCRENDSFAAKTLTRAKTFPPATQTISEAPLSLTEELNHLVLPTELHASYFF